MLALYPVRNEGCPGNRAKFAGKAFTKAYAEQRRGSTKVLDVVERFL